MRAAAIYCGFDDFAACVPGAMERSNRAALSPYLAKYAHVFEPVHNVLLCMDEIAVTACVNALSLAELAERAHAGLGRVDLRRVRQLLDATAAYYDFRREVDVYLLVGLVDVAGTVIPGDRPALYLGLEFMSRGMDLEYVIPHEFNHLVRWCAGDAGPQPMPRLTEMPVKDVAVAEGLATWSPLMVHRQEATEENLRAALMVPEETWRYLQIAGDAIEAMVVQNFDRPLTGDLLPRMYSANREIYYAGTRYIGALLDRGHRLKDLTVMGTDEIVRLHGGQAAGAGGRSG